MRWKEVKCWLMEGKKNEAEGNKKDT